LNILSRFWSCALALLVATAAARAQQEPRHVPTTGNMRLTDSESLWTGRFSDCDFRYYLLIPNGFVAHGNRPPRRLHGVLFGLPDTSTTGVVTSDDERFISVMASSNEFDFKSLKEFADHVLHYLGKGKSGFEIRARQASRLDGEQATRLRVEYDGPDGRVVAEELLSLELGVLYEIGLRTTAEHYDIDAQNFSKVVAGFKSWRNYRCYGTNNNP
jgi:hypothetical protein